MRSSSIAEASGFLRGVNDDLPRRTAPWGPRKLFGIGLLVRMVGLLPGSSSSVRRPTSSPAKRGDASQASAVVEPLERAWRPTASVGR